MPDQRHVSSFSTIGDLFSFAVDRFKKNTLFYGHGTHQAQDEAIYLIFTTLSLPYNHIKTHWDKQLTPDEIATLLHLIEKRVTQRTPTAYLTHTAWQGKYVFYIDERALIPRSFIFELLGEPISPWIPEPNDVHQALDLCTGSGCLAIQLAEHYPQATIDAADISLDALAVATINIQRYQLEKRIQCIHTDLFQNIAPSKTYDLIITNPPYVDAQKMSKLPIEYQHEPAIALSGGDHGLAIIEQIIVQAESFLSEQGILLMEVGDNRQQLEKQYPTLAFMWLATHHGDGNVCLLTKSDLVAPKTRGSSVKKE